jgi:hypothetical protein
MIPLRLEDESSLILGIPDEFFGQLAEDCCGDFLAEALLGIEGVNYTYDFEAGHIVPVQKPCGTTVQEKAVSCCSEESVTGNTESKDCGYARSTACICNIHSGTGG